MKSSVTRLDRFISQRSAFKQADTRLLIAQKRILLDGQVANSIQQQVTQFTHVLLDGQCLQQKQALYLMLHKPKGVVCATQDHQHPTVLDLLEHPHKDQLHIVGRLDLNTTGLVLLTNDGTWSRTISLPQTGLAKTYEVTLAQPVTAEYVEVFRQGIYFAYEGITTQPAELEIDSAHTARLTLTEGKYHQVKRMFGHCQNEVLALHRASVGALTLAGLAVGHSRELTEAELRTLALQTGAVHSGW